MGFSLFLIISVGLLFYFLATRFKLPGLIGFLATGVILGPYGLNLLDETLLMISGDLRDIALVVILLRAGLGLNLSVIKRIGHRAILLSIIPVLLEGFTLVILTYLLLDFSLVEAGLLGFIIAAVSPAVIVPSMLRLQKEGLGKSRFVPSLILASASMDDIVAITIFSAFVSVYTNQQLILSEFVINVPFSIVLGIIVGVMSGLLLMKLFTKFHIRDTKKILLLIAFGLFIIQGSNWLKDTVSFSGLLAIMVIGIVMVEKKAVLASRLAIKFDKIWVLFELILFVLVGALVNIQIAFDSGLIGLIIISLGLMARLLGVYISLIKSVYLLKEKYFIMMSFIPKATVQAALGSVPLMLGVPNGDYILALSVLSIIFTAPLGALLIQYFQKKLLSVSS
ncbi:MAG: cation:proton antiporter [Candidatus Izemoplasmataceae bacterium]